MQNIHNFFINFKNNRAIFIFFLLKNKRIIIPFIFIFLYALLYFLVDFSSQSLVAHDEGLYARRSRLIEETNNWFSFPFENAHHKTIGSYWLIALSIRLFGNSELSLRLPSILSSFLCLIIFYLIALKVSNKKSALISLFSLSSMPLWIQYSRYASPDIPFVLFILLGILLFLNFLNNNSANKFVYIFCSGLSFSVAFFIRSYMVFVPFIGLIPFLTYNLINTKNYYRTVFFTGIIVGLFPTILNLYFSYIKFGQEGITSLFDFAKQQAIGGFNLNNLFLVPFNYFYLTFPGGILFVILFIFTKSNQNIRYPLLVYLYPLLSFLMLLCMSTSYPHYYLFLLPSLSIVLALRLESFSLRFSFSMKFIKYLLFIIIIFVSLIIVGLFLYFNNYLIEYSFWKNIFLYLVSSVFLLSLIFSIRHLSMLSNKKFNLIKLFNSIIIPQYIFLSLLYNFGFLGNPNYKTKFFLRDNSVSRIVNSNTIYLYNVDSKIQTLLSYYLPSSIVINSKVDFNNVKYMITSERNFLNDQQYQSEFRFIRNFGNQILLRKISK